jgi:hypothetical protein
MFSVEGGGSRGVLQWFKKRGGENGMGVKMVGPVEEA